MTGADPARTLEHFRHRTLAELEHQLSSRRLPRDEYDRRVALALSATSARDLKPLVLDLLSPAPVAAAPPQHQRSTAAVRRASTSDDSELAVALMSHSVREGAWDPPETVNALAVMGHVRLDFREAALLDGTTRIHAFALMGGVSVIAPPDVNVRVSGIGLMGGFGRVRRSAPDPDAPTLHIDGLAIMGGVDVRVRAVGADPEQPEEDAD
jgi:hypothetical protein